MPNRTELRQMAAEEAGIIAASETLSAGDANYIDRRIASRLAILLDKGLLPFDIDGVIPDQFMLPAARVIAADMAPGFGLDVVAMAALGEEGMRELRRLKQQPYFGSATSGTYY